MFAAHQVTIDVPDCPTVVPNVAGIPSWVVGWGLMISAVILLALIVSIAVVRYKHHEERTQQLDDRNRALIEGAKAAKNCPGCGMRYSIEKELREVGP